MRKEQDTQLKRKIRMLKEEKNAVILAHNYQIPSIQDAADFLGDSLELARTSKDLNVPLIVLCGVTFMAETVKILSPAKKVLLPVRDAGCPLAQGITPRQVRELKEKYPDAGVVTYVNSSAEVKALSNICCTSGNAVSIVKNAPYKKIIFIPDKNLGWWVKKNVPEKEIILWEGFCYVHQLYTLGDLLNAKKAHPEAEILVHPECRQEILEHADYVLSTSGMLKRARQSPKNGFIIGTEEGILYRLKKENPAKQFYPLAPGHVCEDMKKTDLVSLHGSLEKEQWQVHLTDYIISGAKHAIEEMIKYV